MSRRWIIPALIVALVLGGAVVLNRRGDRAPQASAAKPADAGKAEPRTPVQPTAAELPTGAGTPPPAARAAVPTVRLEGPPDVAFSQMRPSTYTVLALKPEPGTSTHWRLRVRVRLASAPNSGGINFWDSSFRLMVDGVPRAPVSNLNELVESGEAKDGDVLFDVPWALKSLALLVTHYRETAEWPIAVSGTRWPAPLAFPAGPRPVALDAPADVSFPKSPPTVYSILAVGSEARRPGIVGLRLRVRMHVLDGADANFWDSRFRLVVDGVPRAPDSNLNELVGGRAAKDADITFEFPETARQLALRIVHNANDTADLPLKFTSKP